MAFVSSPSSTNEVNTAYGVSTANTQVTLASTQVGTASTQVSTANLSDATLYAFLASQPNGSQLAHEDLVQIHEDELEEIDLKWQLAFLSMRTIRNKNQDSPRRTVNVEDTSSWSQIPDNSRKGVGFVSYNAVPPLQTGLFLPLKLDLSNSGLEEFQQPKFEGYGPKNSKSANEDISMKVKESPDALLVKELVLDDKLEKKTVFPTNTKKEFVRPKLQEKPVRKPVKHMTWNMSYLLDFKEFNEGYVTFEGGANGGIITGKRTLKTSKLDFEDVYFVKELKLNLLSATLDESMLWHRRLGHINFKIVNKLIQDNLVRGLPSKRFENDQTCVACLKGKQHKASCKSKIQNFVTQLLFMLHMDLFGPTFVSSLMNKKYCLVVIDDYSRFTWVFFLATKDETSGILKKFITEIENLVDKKVKVIRCDNRTKFKNIVMNDVCAMKGIRREFSVARTPQQKNVAERRNRTLIEAARTMLADSKLPTSFWAKAVNTACYVQNRVLVVKPHNKTLYELFRGKFDGKLDEGFFVRHSLNSKAFRVYNIRTRKVEENLKIRFLEDKPSIAGNEPKWLFDIDVQTNSMNYVPVIACINSNDFVSTEESIGACHSSKETGSSQDYMLMPLWKDGSLFDSTSKNDSNDEPQPSINARNKDDEGICKANGIANQERPKNSDKDVNTVGPSINTASTNANTGSLNINTVSPTVSTTTPESTHVNFFGDETEVDMSNITNTYQVPSTPNIRIQKDHSLDLLIGDVQSGVMTRRMTKTTNEQGFISAVHERKLIKT
nr:hypothetical protein [Tanacetum cinerariifolium]